MKIANDISDEGTVGRLGGVGFSLPRGYICDKKHKMKTGRWEDHYTRLAREEKWPARSVYKLKEIDERFKIIRKDDRILDMGCFPGSWSQYGAKKVGPKGEVVGIDLIQPDPSFSANFRFVQADVLTLDIKWLVEEIAPRDVVISDLAPKTTGIRSVDTSRSIELGTRAAQIACAVLKKGGHFLCKVFEGEGFGNFRSETSGHFRRARLLRPTATRKASREIYLIGLGFVK